ncbi:hypothetical protein RUND412_010029 [Rhizina undulata]
MPPYVPITGVLNPDPTKPKVEGVYPRRNINDLIANYREQFDLFVQALAILQEKPETDSLSFFGISGIHGVPYIAWPFDDKTPPVAEAGYCAHRSTLFPTWHRPYMLLLEQTIQAEAVKLAKKFTGEARNTYLKAANRLRLPYWDWAANDSVLPRAMVYDKILIAVPGKEEGRVDTKRIPNPLLKYNFQDKSFLEKYFKDGEQADQKFGVQKWSDHLETLRCPDETGESQLDVVDQQMRRNHYALRDGVFKLMGVNEWGAFSNTLIEAGMSANNYQSLEGLHDTIHGLCGIDPSPLDGHMGDPMYAAFDPLFWMHHCNVDRLYALWQTLHPGVHVVEQQSVMDTISEPVGKAQNEKTPLYPFRQRGGKYFTSEDVQRWDSIYEFGYTYPELPAKLFNPDDQGRLKKYCTEKVNELYAPKDPNWPPVPEKAILEANAALESIPKGRGDGKTHIGRNHYQFAPGKYRPFDVKENHHREWICNIRIRNYALDGSFFIHIFLGDFNSEVHSWAKESNLVGTHTVFSPRIGKTECENCLTHHQQGVVVSGSISLTAALLTKGLVDLEPDNVKEYLRQNLHWRVQSPDGDHVANSQLSSLKIIVTSTIVETYDDKSKLPYWGLPQVIKSVTEKRAGGFNENDNI